MKKTTTKKNGGFSLFRAIVPKKIIPMGTGMGILAKIKPQFGPDSEPLKSIYGTHSVTGRAGGDWS